MTRDNELATMAARIAQMRNLNASLGRELHDQAREIERLREALQWMVDHDESREGDEYYLAGLERAKKALGIY